MLATALSLGLIFAFTLAGAVLARSSVGPAAKRVTLGVVLLGVLLGLWRLLPEDQLLRGLCLIVGAFNAAGTVVAVEWRIRNRVEPDSLGAYFFDVLTSASSRTVPELATPGASVPLRALRGVLCAVAVGGIVFGLQVVPADRLPLFAWLYLKLHVCGLGAQALSDLVWAATGGRCVPLMRWPLLSTSFLDFWGRRYNLWVHGLLLWTARDILGLRRRPKLLLVTAFLLSGAFHELMSVLLLGRLTGWLMGFWVAQVVLTFASVALNRLLRGSRAAPVLGLLFVHAGMCLSSPLFFAVFDRGQNMFGPVTPEPW